MPLIKLDERQQFIDSTHKKTYFTPYFELSEHEKRTYGKSYALEMFNACELG